MDHRFLLGCMEGKAARLRQFDETANQVVRRIEQTSALLEERLKDVVQEAGAKPVALVLEEVQETAKKVASVPCFGSSKEECCSQKSCADPLDEAITYWSSMCVVLGQYLEEEPKKAGSSGQPGSAEPPGPADFQTQLSSHSTELDAQIREQGSSLQSLAGQLSSHTRNIANLDQLIWRLMAKNTQLAEEIAKNQQVLTSVSRKHIEEKRSTELRRLKHQVEYAGDAVKRQTKQVRSALVAYEPSQAPERAIENGDSDVYVDLAFLQREGALQNSYCELQLTSLTDATNALRKKSGAVGKAAKLMLNQGESFEAADVLTSCSLSQRALKKLASQKEIWRLAEEEVQGKTFYEWIDKANLDI
ncbi:uncharacterized protein LOC115316018 isoform X1 [Ixodes scapularis]|uniref:uncharacterized protein LOC115316018 isoform X1 n=2 Tax=Ixodes scapularis TaxID=6945 RepID=UPI001C38D302|nr:uncharacterized protein LOC115316018 isoform X1 [Ixodes scapularis]